MASWRTRRAARHDMFGRPAEVPRTSPKAAALARKVQAERRLTARSQRPIPPGLVPWLIPLLIVFVCVVIVVLPGAVATGLLLVLLLGAVAAIVVRRYRFIKSQDGYDRPRNEALFGHLDPDLGWRKTRRRDRER